MKNLNPENGFYKFVIIPADRFYPTVLKNQTMEIYLEEQLKNNGFDHVIFVQNRKGIFSVEGNVEALEKAGLLPADNSREKRAGQGVPMRRKTTEQQEAKKSEQVAGKLTFGDASQFYSLFVRLIRSTLMAPDRHVAIVLPKVFFTSFMEQKDEHMKFKLYRELAELGRSRERTGSIVISFLESEVQDLLMFRDIQYREAFPELQGNGNGTESAEEMLEDLKQTLGTNLQICNDPSPKEIEHMLVRNQLLGNIELDYSLLEDMTSLLAEFIRCDQTRRDYHWINFNSKMPLYSLENALTVPGIWQRTLKAVEKRQSTGSAWEKLQNTRGMEGVAEAIRKLKKEHDSLKNNRDRKMTPEKEADRFEAMEEETVRLLMNMCLVGPPGVGKTFCARMISDVLYELGLLPYRILVETSAGELVGEHIGESEANLRKKFKAAIGGVLFIDEAYQLDYRTEAKNNPSFKKDIMDLLLKLAWDYRGKICIIFAGYRKPIESMLNGIEGFRSRFKYMIEIKPYTYMQLAEISRGKLKEEQITLDETLDALWSDFIRNWQSERRRDTSREYANFRTFEEEFFNRIIQYHDSERVIRAENVPADLRPYMAPHKELTMEEVDRMFDRFYGMEAAKKAAKEMVLLVQNKKKNPDMYTEDTQLANMVFAGPPGTGKTDVAGTIAQVAGECGALEIGHMIAITATDFIKPHKGEGAAAMEEYFMKALDGVLLIDELGSLSQMEDDQMKRFLQLINEYQSRTIIILTGYPHEYEALCRREPGMTRRMQKMITFRMYTAAEMTEIFKTILNRGEKVTFLLEEKGAIQAVTRYFAAALRQKGNKFGNGQEALNLKGKLRDVISAERFGKKGDVIELTEEHIRKAVANLTGQAFDTYCKDVPKQIHTSTGCEKPAAATVKRNSVSVEKHLDPKHEEPTQEFIREASAAVLYLEAEKNGGQAFGTGFLISSDGYAITCNHCVEGISSMRARLRVKGRAGGQDSWHHVTVAATSPEADLALIKLEGSDFPAVSLRDAEEAILPMEKTTLLGYPFGSKTKDGLTCFAGKIASVDPQYNAGGELLLYNGEAKSGNSGSPVFGNDGRVIGVLLGSITERSSEILTEEINYIRPVKYIFKHFIRE